ncbi:MAG: hypothetical protein IJ447_04365 [Clostridia bacterium]|nr:hypothetical protein [Clostridia bacterium]
MFKELKNMDSQNLKSYVNFDNSNLDDTRVYSSMFFNIAVFLIGGVYINSVIVRFIAIVLILACIVSMICFKFKVNKTPKNINLFYACFMSVMAVNLCYNSCLFFGKTNAGGLIPIVIYLIALPIIAFSTIKSESKKIINGSFVGKTAPPVITAVVSAGAMLGISLSRLMQDKISEEIVFGFGLGFLGIVLGAASRFFVKWYCHKLLEQRETE